MITLIAFILLLGMIALLVKVLADERRLEEEQEDDELGGSSGDPGADGAR